MKYAVLLSALLLVACQEKASVTVQTSPKQPEVLTYEYLANYPLNCDLADSQLAELKLIQDKFNLDSDPDKLSDNDRAWNGIIKSNIWWFAYRCNKS
jgi:hypothetical protein